MSKIQKIWTSFLIEILTNTFSEFLTDVEIKERASWIYANCRNIKPNLLFKNILYMLNNNSVSEMAVGYKLHFLQDDYQVLFMDPYSEEFDRNDSLNESDKTVLNDLIKNFSIAINHHVELLLNGTNTVKLNDIISELSKFYNLPKFETSNEMYVRSGDLVYRMNFGQILYMVVYNENPLNGDPCNEVISSSIREKYPHRVSAMQCLKQSWSTNIPRKYTQSSNLF